MENSNTENLNKKEKNLTWVYVAIVAVLSTLAWFFFLTAGLYFAAVIVTLIIAGPTLSTTVESGFMEQKANWTKIVSFIALLAVIIWGCSTVMSLDYAILVAINIASFIAIISASNYPAHNQLSNAS